ARRPRGRPSARGRPSNREGARLDTLGEHLDGCGRVSIAPTARPDPNGRATRDADRDAAAAPDGVVSPTREARPPEPGEREPGPRVAPCARPRARPVGFGDRSLRSTSEVPRARAEDDPGPPFP